MDHILSINIYIYLVEPTINILLFLWLTLKMAVMVFHFKIIQYASPKNKGILPQYYNIIITIPNFI